MSAQVLGRRIASELPRLHAVTDDEVLARPRWEAAAIQVLEAGGADVALHVRGAGTAPRRLLALVRELTPHAVRSGAALVVNDRVDVALVSDVQGVHLGGGSLPPGSARSLLPRGVWIGVSRHDAGGIAAASSEGADYAFLGTIYRTSSHPGVEGLGTAGFTEVVRRAGDVPVLAIGGIGSGEVREVIAAGAYGVAAIRGIWDAPEPGAAVRRYLEELGQRRGEQ